MNALNPDRILALAPDPAAAEASREQAALPRWSGLGASPQAAWGLCQGSAREPYQTQIDLSGPAFRCSCPSRKRPCKHSLGLFLLLADQPGAFRPEAPPSWVEEWLEARRKKSAKGRPAARPETAPPPAAPPEPRVADPAAQARRAAQRQANVRAGMDDLQLWLRDLARQGLATAQGQPLRFWESPAARLVDAQAPGLARQVRGLASLPASGEGWQARLLERAARLFLLLEGFQRLEDLPVELQADVRSLVGWTQSQEELLKTAGIKDRWLILGQRVEEEMTGALGSGQALRAQRVWLWGQSTGQPALVLNFAAPGQALDASLVAGSRLEAELVFYPSAVRLRALVRRRWGAAGRISALPGYPSLEAATRAYAAALAALPWLGPFPLPLQEVIPLQRDGQWRVVDSQGRCLPVSPRYNGGWQLLALSGGRAVNMFGEWDGDFFWPVSCMAGGQFFQV